MKYRFKVENLDCPNCARKVETYLAKNKELNNVRLNFSKLTLSFDTNINNVKKYVDKLIKEVEPEMKILDINEQSNNKPYLNIIRVIIGILFGIIGIIFDLNYLIILSYIILLYKVFKNAIKLLFKKTVNENMLITISCIGAYFTNNIKEGLMVIILYEIGKILEGFAVNNSRKSISELMNIKPEYANLKVNNEIIKVNPNEIKINDIIVVKKGEKIPLDGIIIKGNSKIDNSALTGESRLKEVKENELVLSGSINISDILEIKVTENYENSTVTKILDLVENASDNKAKTENYVEKLAKIYTPIVMLLAVLVIIIFPLVFNMTYSESLYRALTFLVISCPCAIAISVPLSYFSGIGVASKHGILIKGSDYLDTLRNVDTIIFDKTGTLTTGKFNNYKLTILNNNYKEKEIIDYFIKGETFSNHPIAKSIINNFNKKVSTKDVIDFKEKEGLGISYQINNDKILIGSSKFVKNDIEDKNIYLKINKEIIAKLELADEIKKEAKKTIEKLNKMNIKTIMFTGDNKDIALEISKELNIDCKYELLPIDKYNLLKEEMDKNKEIIAFIGDGVNDAPSLAVSNIGISMGSIGSSSAIEASDIVIVNDDVSKIIDAILISKKTHKIVKQNLIFSISIKILVLLLSALGMTSMWQAVFADTGLTLLAIINTTRILKK